MSVTAIVPLKSLSAAKGRLAVALRPDERQAVVAWMLGRVVEACRQCRDIADTLVIAGDEAAAAAARAVGARAEVEHRPGLVHALATADALTGDHDTTMVVAADLPDITGGDLQAVIDAAGTRANVVVIAPTRDGGTGALLRRPPQAIEPAYGLGSAAVHRERAVQAGVPVVTLHRAGLALDIDTPEQLRAALASRGAADVGSRRP